MHGCYCCCFLPRRCCCCWYFSSVDLFCSVMNISISTTCTYKFNHAKGNQRCSRSTNEVLLSAYFCQLRSYEEQYTHDYRMNQTWANSYNDTPKNITHSKRQVKIEHKKKSSLFELVTRIQNTKEQFSTELFNRSSAELCTNVPPILILWSIWKQLKITFRPWSFHILLPLRYRVSKKVENPCFTKWEGCRRQRR
jgi:hypothetical protein